MPPKYFVPRSEFIDFKTTAIPKEVRNTGDPVIINNCLNTNKALTFNDQQVLKGRLDAMNFVSEMVAEQNNSKHQPPKAYRNENGWQLPALHQNHQNSANGCWAMPVQLMLQSRGIEVPQNAIRYYRPVISGPESADMTEEQTRELNSDTANNIARGAELLQRLLPNTMVFQSAYGSSELPLNDDSIRAYRADLKKQVTSALSENGSPVALLIGGHYRTIVGIDGDDLIVKDSLNNPVVDERLSLDEVFAQAKQTDTKSVEISWLRDMDVEKGAVQTDDISEAWPFIERKDDNLSIDSAVFNDLTAGENSRFSNFSYEDHGVFSNTLNVQQIRGRSGLYIRDAIIFPKTLTPNVRELEPIETYAPMLPEKPIDPEAIVPDPMTANSINDVEYENDIVTGEDEMYANSINGVDDEDDTVANDNEMYAHSINGVDDEDDTVANDNEMYAHSINDVPDEEETPEQHIEGKAEENTEAKDEPEQKAAENTKAKEEPEQKAEEKAGAEPEPEQKIEADTKAKDEPEQPQGAQTQEEFIAQKKAEAKKMSKADAIKTMIDAAPPLTKPEEKTEPVKPEEKAKAEKKPELPKDKVEAEKKSEPPKDKVEAEKIPVQPAEKAPAEKAAPASAVKTPVEQPPKQPVKQPIQKTAKQPIQKTAKQPVQQPAKQPAKQPVQQPAKQIPADQYPTAADAPDVNSMLDNEISNYLIPSSSYKSKYMDVDMYPPKPSMLKELCKSFGLGLLGMVRSIPILGSIVGFFADVITRAVESYDNLMEKLDAQRPFMAGEDVYNMAVYNVIKKAPKTPETAKLFADPKFQQSLVQFAAQDPDLNYAATHNHSPEFYKKYMMSEKGFNKLSEKFTKQVLKGIDMATAKPELSPDVAKKMKAMQAAEKQKKQQQKQKQKQKNQPKINAPSAFQK